MQHNNKQKIFDEFYQHLESILQENIKKQDKYPNQLRQLLVDSGMKQLSIRFTQEIFFNTQYSAQQITFKIKKYEDLVRFISEQKNSNRFFRYIFHIRQKQLLTLLNQLSLFTHKLIKIFLNQKNLFQANQSTILNQQSSGFYFINESFNIPLGIPCNATPQMNLKLEGANPKSILSNFTSKINQNPRYDTILSEDKKDKKFQSKCSFVILKTNKVEVQQQTFIEKGQGLNKNQAQQDAAKNLLIKIWHKHPNLLKLS